MMLAIKPAAVLLLLGMGGLLGINEAPRATTSAADSTVATPVTVDATARAPDDAALRTAVVAALSERMRADLDDAGAQLVLRTFAVDRASLRTLEARGEGVVQIPGARSIPVQVVGAYDLVDGRLESVDYTAQPVETELTAVDRAVRAAIGRRVGERIATDFPDQPTRFELLEVSRAGYGRHRTRMEGVGITDFGAEGLAYTPFVATLDKHTGELLELEYELLQEDPALTAGF
jgi:hypothetical protein